MRHPVLLLAALAALVPASASGRLPASPDKLLAGYVAGEPRACLAPFERDRESRAYASGDILYRGSANRWYLNHPQGCPRLRHDQAFVTLTPGGQLCEGDVVRVVDTQTHFEQGTCVLSKFVPYTRAK